MKYRREQEKPMYYSTTRPWPLTETEEKKSLLRRNDEEHEKLQMKMTQRLHKKAWQW